VATEAVATEVVVTATPVVVETTAVTDEVTKTEEARAKVKAAKATGRKFAEAAKVVVEVMTRKKMGYVRIYYLVISWRLIVVWISAPNRIGF
jgi:hypothetical protein